jgi:molybdopterin molybdotransferase
MTTELPPDLPHRRTPVADARALIVAALTPLPTESVALADLAGRVVGAPVIAPHDLPRHANSAMDGYAVAADTPSPWPLSAHILAGDDPAPLVPGTAAAIATGGVVPEGADAVIPLERVEEADAVVTALAPVAPGAHIRPVGADAHAGDVVIAAGQRLTPLAASAISGLGLTAVQCARRPRVVVLTTGDELVPPGQPLRRGQIHESNSILVAATLAAAGCEIVRTGGVPDTAEATRRAFADAIADADLVVSTGGVSVGPRDHVKPALRDLGVDELFWRIATQPGQPVWCGVAADGTLVAGLPGNPLSCLVGLHLLLIPAVRALTGAAPEPQTIRAELAAPISQLPERLRAIPMRLVDGRLEQLGASLSHQLSRAAQATALALIPTGDGELPAGTVVDAVPLG